jgi:drug/metabolite transporter (DMT)-like permease
MLWQVTLWHDPLDPMATIGAGVIVVGAYINLHSGRSA